MIKYSKLNIQGTNARATIPLEIRKILGLKDGDTLIFNLDKNGIVTMSKMDIQGDK